MIAAWMLYAIAVALLITAAAFPADHALRALGRPTRFVWLGALLVLIGVTGVRLFGREAATSITANRSLTPSTAVSAGSAARLLESPAASSAPLPDVRPAHQGLAVPRQLSAFDRPLLFVWAAASLAWAALLFGSGARVHRRRRSWRPELIDGVPVYVSHDTGPALFGIARYSIVVPSWVVELPVAQRSLIMAHESEHARAGDPVVLLCGALAVLIQPWNPLVWWMFRRLCFAVEADCDARVIGTSHDVRQYGELLLDIGARTLAGASPVAALSEPHSLLARRISRMTARPFTRPVLRALSALAITAAAVVVACWVPQPTVRPTTAVAITPAVDFIQYRWVDTAASAAARFSDSNGEPLALTDTVVLDIGGIDSAWVAPRYVGTDTLSSVMVALLPDGAARFGAATATHVGRRIAVVVDGRVATTARIASALGPIVPLVTGVSRSVADSLTARVNHIVGALRPVQPLTIRRAPRAENDSVQNVNAGTPAVLHLTSLGLELAGTATPRIRIYTTGQARVGLGLAVPAELSDTLHLDHLPSMTLDITSGTVHLEIEGPSRMRLGGNFERGPVEHVEMRGRKIVVTRSGVSTSDT